MLRPSRLHFWGRICNICSLMLTQLANGPVKSLAKPDVKLNGLKSVCVGIHELTTGGPSFRPNPFMHLPGSLPGGNQQEISDSSRQSLGSSQLHLI